MLIRAGDEVDDQAGSIANHNGKLVDVRRVAKDFLMNLRINTVIHSGVEEVDVLLGMGKSRRDKTIGMATATSNNGFEGGSVEMHGSRKRRVGQMRGCFATAGVKDGEGAERER
ncbi:hypothetical protein SEMRO_2491_G329140.1 [Seminavis robusta]|uniref:Uncharacterized protein n=1 Tax=Seminavis robusta TaxID=568900 RepID=A0A9N8HXG5_9STRA|nr:hypothetical protein SEMRO_2491_G329140.1 [Seminavis robusta]|eukprot:Sro2491_g329140.1 n/a (114) ;mRNA; r:5745-6086